MKKLFICMATSVGSLLAQEVLAQNAVINLQANCKIFPSGQFILAKSKAGNVRNLTMAQYNSDDKDGFSFAFEKMLIYYCDHSEVQLNELANDIWLLIAYQLNGELGQLSLTHGNIIATRDGKNIPVLVLISWLPNERKWCIFSTPVAKVKSPKKGTRVFY